MRNRGVLLLALLIAAVLAAGSAFALINAGDDSGPKVDALPTASPTPTATETPSATPTATPTESATPEPTATATTSPTAKPTASATSKPTSSGTYSYPKPSHSYQGLELTLSSPDNNQPAGEDFVLTVKSSDGDGKIFFNGLSWGDGQSEPAAANPQHCKSYPQPPTSPQGAYQPQPDSKTFTFHHKYLVGGRDYVIAVKVASVNGDCRPNGPKREDTKLYLRIHVDPAA